MKPKEHFHWEVTGSQKELSVLIDSFFVWTRSFLREGESRISMSLALALDELYMNALRHGYKDKSDDFWISIDAEFSGDRIEVIYRDRSPQFNPLVLESIRCRKKPATQIIEDMPVGGLGIHLIHRFVDGISYNFVEGQNEIRFTKKVPPSFI